MTFFDIISVLAKAVIKKINHNLGGLNYRDLFFFFIVPAAWKSKIKVPYDLVPGEDSLSGL